MTELGHPRVLDNTSSPASPTYTDLESVQAAEVNNYQGAASSMPGYNTQSETVFYPGDNQPEPWNEGQVRCQQFNIAPSLRP